MKVLHIATIDNGGAYKAAERFHRCLLQRGIESKILVRTKLFAGDAEKCFCSGREALLSKARNLVNLLLSRGEIARDVLGTDISRKEIVQDADILVLHWINSFLSVKSLEKLFLLNKPIIFMMHDMWLFTGGCHVAGECRKYEEGCGKCPLIPSGNEKDISALNFREKKALLKKNNVVVTGPSPWIVECAGRSPVLTGKNIVCMPNMIDTHRFRPLENRKELRRRYGMPEDKKIVLFGAADSGTGNRNKGFSYLARALEKLEAERYHLVIFGNSDGKLELPDEYARTLLGYIQEEAQMAEIYNLADVYVTPSLQETFGFTVCESMACGTPVAAFAVGGILNQIMHKSNGYLAEKKNVEDLAAGIAFCAENSEKLGGEARKGAERFSFEAIGERYEKFLREICEKI